MGSSAKIPGREHQAYIVGSGVTAQGAQNLAKKLACMTVGDLDALLQIKDIDPIKVALLLKEIQDLAKALVCHDIHIYLIRFIVEFQTLKLHFKQKELGLESILPSWHLSVFIHKIMAAACG